MIRELIRRKVRTLAAVYYDLQVQEVGFEGRAFSLPSGGRGQGP